MTDQINVVIKVADEIIADPGCGLSCVANELSLRHLVFDMWTRQVDGKHDEGVTKDVHRL